MNKNILVIAGVVVVVVIVGGTYVLFNSKDDAIITNEKIEDTTTMEKSSGTIIKAGSYELYSSDKLALAEKGKVVLFFRASWCPTCRALDANIRSNLGAIPEGVTILDVDYDNSTTLKQKYGVTYQHTLVQVDATGEQIAKWTGSPTLANLVLQIK